MSKSANKYIDKALLFSLFFIAITFPLPYKISNIGLGLLVFSWIAKFVVEGRLPKFYVKENSDKIILFSSIGFFVWNVISLIYTDNQLMGWKNVESKLTIFILPIIFYSISIPFKTAINLYKAFIYSIALCTIVLSFQSVTHYFQDGSLLTYHDFTQSLDFHAVFYSYDIFISILLSVFLFIRTSLKKIEKQLLIFCLALSFIGLIVSASKNVLVVTTAFLLAGLIYKLFKNRLKLKEILLFLSILIVAAIAFISVPSIGNRISELTQLNGMENYYKIKHGEKLDYRHIANFNGTSMRITFWDVALNKQRRDSQLILGYSPGDRRAVINKEFYRVSLNPWYENYNLHNQFIQILVELGIIGLIIYFLLHIGFIINALKNRNFVLLAFVIGIVFFQLTESIIERNKGIVFVVFFLLLLARLNTEKNENRDIRN